MLRATKTFIGVLAAGLALGAGTAQANNLAVDALGAALALPILTTTSGGERVTIHTISNALHEPIRLHFNVISGDPGDAWDSNNYDCDLTPRETTWVVFQNNGDTSNMTFECSVAGLTNGSNPGLLNIVHNKTPKAADGILFVTVEWTAGQQPNKGTRLEDAIFGDATVIDFGQGYAFSVGAIPLQRVATGVTPETQDTDYMFDGAEYRAFPSVLVTNFIAPDDDITAELILFTLDGTAGQGSVPVGIDAEYYDDDEESDSGSFDFDCFVVRALNDAQDGLGDGITRFGLGSIVGHVQLTPAATVLGADLHDLNPAFGDMDNRRIRPFHGWLMQTMARLGDINDTDAPQNIAGRSSNQSAWGRTLVQSTTAIVPSGGDIPGFDGR